MTPQQKDLILNALRANHQWHEEFDDLGIYTEKPEKGLRGFMRANLGDAALIETRSHSPNWRDSLTERPEEPTVKQPEQAKATKHPHADFLAEALKDTSRKIEGQHRSGLRDEFSLENVVKCDESWTFRFADTGTGRTAIKPIGQDVDITEEITKLIELAKAQGAAEEREAWVKKENIGTYNCPICQCAVPHSHTSEQIVEYRNRLKSKSSFWTISDRSTGIGDFDWLNIVNENGVDVGGSHRKQAQNIVDMHNDVIRNRERISK